MSEVISANSAAEFTFSMTFDANSGHYVQHLPEKGGVKSDIDRYYHYDLFSQIKSSRLVRSGRTLRRGEISCARSRSNGIV